MRESNKFKPSVERHIAMYCSKNNLIIEGFFVNFRINESIFSLTF